jgi:hypothetical protein
LVRVLVLNAVPLYGVFRGGWSWGTVLVLYWCESFLGGLLVLARMVVHRRLTGKRGYRRGQLGLTVSTDGSAPRTFRSFVAEFLTLTLVFSLAHALFLALLLAFARDQDPGALVERLPLERGVATIALLLLGSFVVDLQGIRDRPFAWMRAMAQAAAGRAFVIHATVIAGMLAQIFLRNPHVTFRIFAVLKLLLELGGTLPIGQPASAPSGQEAEDERDASSGPPGADALA